MDKREDLTMTDKNNQHPYNIDRLSGDGTDAHSVSDRTRLLRAAADAELIDAQQVELQRHLELYPQDKEVIEFEKRMREMIELDSHTAAPESLHKRIRAMSQTACPETVSVASQSPANSHSSIRFPRPSRWFAVAASLAIVAGGSFMLIRPAHTLQTDNHQITPQYRSALVSFIHSQHEECELYTDLIGERFKTTDLDSVPSDFSRVLGGTPDIGHVQQYGFKLLGAGPCAVPGRGKSVRMVLESTESSQLGDGAEPLVSVHIQQDTGELNLVAGKTYQLIDQTLLPGETAAAIYVWRLDGFVYFLTSSSKPTLQMALTAFGVQEPSDTL